MSGNETADPIDMSEEERLRDALLGMCEQFAYRGTYRKRLCLTTGGLSALEDAFFALGWKDPHPYTDAECDEPKCHKEATCGTPTPNGYRRVCGKHYTAILKAMTTPQFSPPAAKGSLERNG